jgi:hypothetical protein
MSDELVVTAEVDQIRRQICAAFPRALVTTDAPIRRDGTYHLDIRLDDRLVVVTWNLSRGYGYGISLVDDAALDSGPDVVVGWRPSDLTVEAVVEHVIKRLTEDR